MKTYNIAVIGGDGTGPEVVREAIKVLDVGVEKIRPQTQLHSLSISAATAICAPRKSLPDSAVAELRKFPAILLGAIGHPGRQAGHPGKGHPAAPALRAGAVHQPAARETLRRALLPVEGQEARRTSISSSCARTTKAFTPARAASCSRARRTRWPSRKASTRAAASSAACATRSSTPASATRTRSSRCAARPTC